MAVSGVLSRLATVASVALVSLVALVMLEARCAEGAGMGSCYDGAGRAQRCLPEFENAAFGRRAEASHTCGRPPEDFCPHVGAPGAGPQCQRCDDADPRLRHDASYLTDFHNPDDSTWWQSPSMAFGVQYPTSVNLTLRLGKAYEITYVRLKFHTSRPESFAIYKRTHPGGPWEPYQYYSASCQKTYGRPEGHYLWLGENERVAFCTSEFSDISPLNGGNVAFSTLEGRPSAYNFEESPVLQEWVTSTELLISLDRLNTFGDDIFKDPRVLQSYYYAVSDFSVGGRCKCHGHASECGPDEAGQLVCRCQHNTTGADCERCLPFFQDRPWARGTAEDANECLPCNCSGHSEECTFDRELFRSTGHGGHCRHCRDHTAGPHCEHCERNYYRWAPRTPCQPCDCHPAGSLSLQCDDSGTCTCKPTVTGWKCDRCRPGFHSLSEGGCRPCACNDAGSLGTCDPHSGNCPCKKNVEGSLCDRCRPGTFNLQPHNPAGCSSCFCYGHSKVCAPAAGFQAHPILSDFRHGAGGWQARSMGASERPLQWNQSGILLGLQGGEGLSAPEKFLGDQRLSYGQPVILTLQVPPGGSPPAVHLRLEGAGLALALRPSSPPSPQDTRQPGQVQLWFLLQETSEEAGSTLPAFHFQRLLANLTALSIWTRGQSLGHAGQVFLCEVRLMSARPQTGLAPPASWVETCLCPQGYAGQFCEFCAQGYKRELPRGGPYTNCIPCTCNQHGTCDPNTGICLCGHHTEGPSCERCMPGFYGNAFSGHAGDCQPCPCPGQSACTTIPESGEVVCTHCPPGQRGRRCESCEDGFFGDPLGLSGAPQPCRRCQCSGNVDPNAVGNCDPQTGHCLRCLYNTTGTHCERCQDGFYGSASAARPEDKCAPCSCDLRGSVSEKMPCNSVTGQCACLPHVTGRDCSHCSPGFYDLQSGRGCQSCKCHPLGSLENKCHPKTGQCPCRPGVTGQFCDRCQLGFFGFSIKGCRDCRCSPLGAASPQCHENSTCVCRPGFVGYKCDHCQDNFFLGDGDTGCQECPTCYALVREEAAKLKARLMLMEGWLQGSDCGSPWGPLDILQGEGPRGDVYQGHHVLQEAREAFLEQIVGLQGAMKATWEQFQVLRGSARCAQAGAQKTCLQLTELGEALRSSEEEVLRAASALSFLVSLQEVSSPPTNWSHLASEAHILARSHRDTATAIEAAARRALLVSNTSHERLWDLLRGREALAAQRELEDRYQEVQAAQNALGTAVAEVLPKAEKSLATVKQVIGDAAPRLVMLVTPGAMPQNSQARHLDWKVKALEQELAQRERQAVQAVGALQAEAGAALKKMEPFTQLRYKTTAALTRASSAVQAATMTVTGAKTLLADLEGMKLRFPLPKEQAALKRRAGSIGARLLEDTKRKTRQAERMLGNAASLSSIAKKKSKEAELLSKDNAKLTRALLREGKQRHRHASRLAGQTQATLRQASRLVLTSEARKQEQEEANQVASGLSTVEHQIQESRGSLVKDIKVLSELLAKLGSLDTHQAPAQTLNETQRALEDLRLQLGSRGALHRKLRRLEQESARQELQIQSFESDLAEIRADKHNLETILSSLPEHCAS
ncbi:laminin subunit gamma-3 isoform X1 [Peromyscus californicus insignis]|uniref:laminin subunit gamma-3 isoform X1 n=1 Tax=Peromyscus californicus insignis TaxID=564181 RepID=UPI0022A701DA|nr:laminin subunit gamma-3 isoform X1 [Peromyscus californicus insignis]